MSDFIANLCYNKKLQHEKDFIDPIGYMFSNILPI
jgi:hypothetical protein